MSLLAAGRRRPLHWLLLIVLLAGLGLAPLPPSPLRAQALPAAVGPGDLYLSLGDSIAAGVGATAPSQRGFPAIVTGWLNRLASGGSVTLRTLAVGGETSQTMLDSGQLARAETALRVARADGRRISPLTLSIGGNDLLRLESVDGEARRQALDRFRRNLNLILDRLETSVTINGQRQAAIVVLTVYNPRRGDATIVGSDAWWIEQFNGVIRGAATSRGLGLVDLWSLFAGQEEGWTRLSVGDIHPSNAGHLAIAEAVWRTLSYDQTAPTVELVAPVAGELARAVPTVRARVSDAVGVTRVELWVDGRRVRELTWLPDHGLYIAPWDGRAAGGGTHQLEVRAVDVAGNVGRAVVSVRLR